MQFLDAVEPFTLALVCLHRYELVQPASKSLAFSLTKHSQQFTRILGYSENEARAVVARVKNDLVNTEAHTYAPFHFIWGRKPAGF